MTNDTGRHSLSKILFKTKLCKNYFAPRRTCARGDKCTFAHSESELRCTKKSSRKAKKKAARHEPPSGGFLPLEEDNSNSDENGDQREFPRDAYGEDEGNEVPVRKQAGDYQLVMSVCKKMEKMLDEVLRRNGRTPATATDRPTFAEKLRAMEPGVLSNSVIQTMRRLSQIRNALAHEMDCDTVPDRDDYIVKYNKVQAELQRILDEPRRTSFYLRPADESDYDQYPSGAAQPPPPAAKEQQQEEVTCPLCLEDRPLSLSIAFSGCKHAVCRQCLVSLVDFHQEEKTLCKCPECATTLYADELKRLLPHHPYVRRYEDVEIKEFLNDHQASFIRCPSPRCGAPVELPEGLTRTSGEGVRVCCRECNLEFCGACSVHPYHFKVTCAEAERRTGEWKEIRTMWQRGERDDIRNRQRRREDMVRDERWKEEHCVHCPNCNKVVQKLDGCDAMRCGRDADGGNEQQGCNARFSWNEAREKHRYTARMPTVDELHRLRRQVDGVEAGALRHTLHTCGVCGERPKGTRFECMNCPGEVSLCHGCAKTHARHLRNATHHRPGEEVLQPCLREQHTFIPMDPPAQEICPVCFMPGNPVLRDGHIEACQEYEDGYGDTDDDHSDDDDGYDGDYDRGMYNGDLWDGDRGMYDGI